eukprot:scaffold24676_cov61-Phaeocystis_antarctica.AAC.10
MTTRAQGARQLQRHHRHGEQLPPPAACARQGGREPLDRAEAQGAWCRDERRRPPDGRRRGQGLGRAALVLALGLVHQGPSHAQQEAALEQAHRAPTKPREARPEHQAQPAAARVVTWSAQ